jgi:hypothetical protein
LRSTRRKILTKASVAVVDVVVHQVLAVRVVVADVAAMAVVTHLQPKTVTELHLHASSL